MAPGIRAGDDIGALGMSAATGDLSFAHVFEAGNSPWTLLLLHGTGGG